MTRTLYDIEMDGAVLGVAAHPENPSLACAESGCDTFNGFQMACDTACDRGLMTQDGRGYTLTTRGRAHGVELLRAEQARDAADLLTTREASAAHSDWFHAGLALDHPAARKLLRLMTDNDGDPLTADEADAAASAIIIQGCAGRIRAAAVAKLQRIAAEG